MNERKAVPQAWSDMSMHGHDHWLLNGGIVTELDARALTAFLSEWEFRTESGGWYVEARNTNEARLVIIVGRPQYRPVMSVAVSVTQMEATAGRLSAVLAASGIQHGLEVYEARERMTTYFHYHWPLSKAEWSDLETDAVQ